MSAQIWTKKWELRSCRGAIGINHVWRRVGLSRPVALAPKDLTEQPDITAMSLYDIKYTSRRGNNHSNTLFFFFFFIADA